MDGRLIIIVEDSDEDYFITTRAFKKAGMTNKVLRFPDGQLILDYLSDDKNPLPAIILLDLNLPIKDGKEVLKVLKASTRLSKIPVVILTTSNAQSDIEACYAIGANSYIQKPVDIHGLIDAIKLLKHYWFEIVLLPQIQE